MEYLLPLPRPLAVVLEATPQTPRRWKLRRPRNDAGRPLSESERYICPDADLYRLIAAVIKLAVEDMNEGYTAAGSGTANQRYWRAQAYLFFFHGQPTGFETFMTRLGLDTEAVEGRLPSHELFHEAAILYQRRGDLLALELPPDLFDRRLGQMETAGDGR